MASIGQRLKTARNERGISIEEIALSTHIHKEYLEKIENDLPINLPSIYTRAFIKSFALNVGLNPEDLFEPSPEESPAAPEAGSPEAPATRRVLAEDTVSASGKSSSSPPRHPHRVLIVLSVLITAILILSILFLQHQRHSESVQEVSFPELTQEKGQKPGTALQDSQSHTAVQPQKQNVDSLTLEAVSTDTVWLHLVIDSVKTQEYTLPPQHRMKWKGMRSFSISVGNAGGVYFTLNGVHLGTLGQGKVPLKNILLTSESLRKRQTSAHDKVSVEKP